MTDAKALITVWLHVPPEREEEFNDWYDHEHVPLVVRIPGVVRGRRYEVDGAKPKYLAWYDAADEQIEPGADFQRFAANLTPWWARLSRFLEHRERMNFRLMRDVGEAPAQDTP